MANARITFHPLGNADCTRLDLADGTKILVDYADVANTDDPSDKRIKLSNELKTDLRKARRGYYDVVVFTHLDDDHCHGFGDFFWLEHAAKYQDPERVKIRELWVPASAIVEVGTEDSARLIRQEARHRLKEGHGVRVFSRPARLKKWLKDNGLTLESRAHLITDAGQFVPGFSTTRPERVKFFVHSPFASDQNEATSIDRNHDSVAFQATFLAGSRETHALFMSDMDHFSIGEIVEKSRRHKNSGRLLWDVFKIPHHCSYLSVGPDKGADETSPTEEVKWLYETQGRERCIMVSSSKPIPPKGNAEDRDPQPPHRQAAAYYNRVARKKDGRFTVTMEFPSQVNPKPSTIEITERGASLLGVSVGLGSRIVTSTPVRAG